jgi:hypothetical protein
MKALVVEVPHFPSLYSREAASFLSELREVLWSSSRHDVIVLVQEGSRRDLGNVDLDDGWLLRAKFSKYLREWNELLTQIRELPVLVIYHATGDVLGSWFELCLACNIRVFSEAGHYVGFPQLREGLIPLFNSLNFSWHHNEIRQFEFLESAPVRTWREFYLMQNWYRSAVPWKTLYFEVDTVDSLIKILQASLPSRSSSSHSRRGPDAIELSLSKGTPRYRWFTRNWEGYKRSIRHRLDSFEFLLESFYRWASMNISFSDSETVVKTASDSITFEISDYYPPVQVVYRAIIRELTINFVYQSRNQAILYLTNLRTELLRLVGTLIGEDIWQKRIRWFQSSGSVQPNFESFRFSRDGEVVSSIFGVVGRRSGGNRFHTRLGIIEIDARDDRNILGVDVFGAKVIPSNGREILGVWASVYLQKKFCKLILHYEKLGLDLSEAEVYLRNRGWGAFVMRRSRQIFFDFFPLTHQDYLEISDIPELKTPPLFISNLKLLSLHLKIVAGHLARSIVTWGVVENIENADLLVASAIELPDNLKSVVGLANGFALKRIEEDFSMVPEFMRRMAL